MNSKSLSQNISPSTIKKAVVSHTLQKPLTVYPATIGILGGFYALLFGANPIALGVLAVGGSITLSNWAYEYFAKGDVHANQYVVQFRKELEKRRLKALEHLENELTIINNDQAVVQVMLFRKKFDNFHSILDRKLESSELTYNRYLSIAEQVFLNGLDNLENAAISLKSISTINEQRIIAELKRINTSPSKESEEQSQELKARLELRNNQLERVNDLLMVNEKALTQLDIVATKLANIDTQQNHAHIDMEDAMGELQRLIVRAENYSNKPV